MKKILAALLCAVLLIPACAVSAEETSAGSAVPASGLSALSIFVRTDPASRAPVTGSDLAFVREQVIAELKSRPEWKETKIPSGQWTVGTDLPAGAWSFRRTEKGLSTTVTFSHKVGHTVKEEDFYLVDENAVGRAEPAEGTVLTVDGAVMMAPPLFPSVLMKDTKAVPAYTAASLTDIPYDGLISLQRELLELVVLSPDFESVVLPAGIWTVGEDIPAGAWTARQAERSVTLRNYKDAVTYSSSWEALITGAKRVDLNLKDGWKLSVSDIVLLSRTRD